MRELQSTYNHEAYLTTRQIIDHDVFTTMSMGKSRVRAITDVLDHYCNFTDKYDKWTPTQKYAFLDEIGAQIDLAIDDARLDIGYIISKENNNGRNEEDDSGSEGITLSGDGDDNGEAGGAEEDSSVSDGPDQASSEAD